MIIDSFVVGHLTAPTLWSLGHGNADILGQAVLDSNICLTVGTLPQELPNLRAMNELRKGFASEGCMNEMGQGL